MANLKFLDLTGVTTLKNKILAYVDEKDADSIKGVGLSEDGKKMLFYKEEPIEGATPAYEVTLPETDLSDFQHLIADATAGNFVSVDENGQVIDSGKKASDFATATQGAKADTAVQSVETGSANGTIAVDGEDVAVKGLGSAAYTESTAYDAAGAAANVLGDVTDTAADNTVYGAKAAAATAQTAANAAQSDVDALEAFVGDIPDGYDATTITGYIEEVKQKIEAEGYDDTALKARVTAVEDQVDTLIGDDADKSVRTIATEALTEALIPENAKESLDTLTEIAAWIQSHPDDASAMNNAILANTSLINALKDYVGEIPENATATTVIAYIMEVMNDAIADANLDQYAKATDLTAAIARIAANETDIANIKTSLAEGGATYNAIVDAKKAGTDAQADVDELKAYVGTFTPIDEETTVIEYIDAKASSAVYDDTALKNRVTAVEDEITEITDADAGILAQAKSYADTQDAAKLAESKAYTDALASGQVAANTQNITTNTQNISLNTTAIAELQETVDSIEAIPISEIEALFN